MLTVLYITLITYVIGESLPHRKKKTPAVHKTDIQSEPVKCPTKKMKKLIFPEPFLQWCWDQSNSLPGFWTNQILNQILFPGFGPIKFSIKFSSRVLDQSNPSNAIYPGVQGTNQIHRADFKNGHVQFLGEVTAKLPTFASAWWWIWRACAVEHCLE